MVELKITFKEGGAFDFHSNFERIKDRLQQALEHARDRGFSSVQGPDGRGVVDYVNIHLDELPAYDGSNNATSAAEPDRPFQDEPSPAANVVEPVERTPIAPAEPPPGYEEVQQQSVAEELEEQLRRGR